jgi:metallo-beta-lactamase family protein
MVKLHFLGANRQVTGSCYLLEAEGLRVLIDCGLYQERSFLERNWNPFPVPPDTIDYLLLTHVHLDHSGLIPKLVREGFSGPILMTGPSKELTPIMLTDSARIQEEDAVYKKKRHKREGRKGPYPEIPLYTVRDAERVYPLFHAVPYQKQASLGSGVSVSFQDAGHILGSAMLELRIDKKARKKHILFSGDIGQWNRPLVKDPSVFAQTDCLIMESTYGDRDNEDPAGVEDLLCDIINETVDRGGNLVIPTFAVERAQELLFHLSRLAHKNRIPYLMTFLDSPMAVDVTEVYVRNKQYLDRETFRFIQEGKKPFGFPGLRLVRSVGESKAINAIKGSCIIMAGSGMCTGGRIKHHLIRNIVRPESTILFVGYQAYGTLGRQIADGKSPVRIHGQHFQVKAKIAQIHGFSAHADRKGLLKWLDAFRSPPSQLFLTHGEKNASQKFSASILKRKEWKSEIPEYKDFREIC